MNSLEEKCILCSSKAREIKELDRDSIILSFIKRGIINKEDNLVIKDYYLMRCESCNLEFASPMLEPTSEFYNNIIVNSDKYYPKFRWEWGEFIQALKKDEKFKKRKVTLLDVGCGSGVFLEFLNTNIDFIKTIGIDSTPSSIEACKNKGIEAVCSKLSEFKPSVGDSIDIVTMWHVLEHVSDPVDLINEVKSLLSIHGSLYFSVPLSPASYETLEFDPLNLPPHHLTRWSINSLRKLAETTEMSIEIYLPKAESFLFRTLRSIVIITERSFSENNKFIKLSNLLKLIGTNPLLVFKAFYLQSLREKYNKRVQPDLVLVKLTKTIL